MLDLARRGAWRDQSCIRNVDLDALPYSKSIFTPIEIVFVMPPRPYRR
jgi:hypothetical protein